VPSACWCRSHERCHRSGRYDRICRKLRLPDGGKYGRAARRAPARGPKKRHKLTRSKAVNRSRSRKARAMPELSLAVASACLLILAARARTGNGSDAPDLDPLCWRTPPSAPPPGHVQAPAAGSRSILHDADHDQQFDQGKANAAPAPAPARASARRDLCASAAPPCVSNAEHDASAVKD
jgi:hypothetical protein